MKMMILLQELSLTLENLNIFYNLLNGLVPPPPPPNSSHFSLLFPFLFFHLN
ncbi:hypothetical protein LguiA_014780 [Lonicera macranthoides]